MACQVHANMVSQHLIWILCLHSLHSSAIYLQFKTQICSCHPLVILGRKQPFFFIHPALFELLFATLWTVAHQAPLSMGFSRQEYWEWGAISFSRGSSWPRDRTQVSHVAGRRFKLWATREEEGEAKGGQMNLNKSAYNLILVIDFFFLEERDTAKSQSTDDNQNYSKFDLNNL